MKLIKAEDLKEVFPNEHLKKTSAEERIENLKTPPPKKNMGKTTMTERILENTNAIMKSLDTGAGISASGLFIAGGAYLERGEYKLGFFLLVLGVFLSIVKNRLEDGPITKLLRGDILKNIRNTFGK